MSKVMDFSATKGSNWYKKGNFDTANKELGIRAVRFNKPNGTHERVIASAIIEMDNGLTVFGTVYLASNKEDLTFGVQQRKYQSDGEDRYADINVSVPLPIQAYVLNLAEARMTEGPVTAPAQPAEPAQPAQPAQNQVDPGVAALLQGLASGQVDESQLLSMLKK